MPTQKLGLPLITGNMSADVPRDLNALAQKIDSLAGVPLGHAMLDADGNVIGIKAMIAKNVVVEDPKNIFTGTNVEVVLEELFINADNAQRALASVVGSPTTAGDTFTKIRTDIQTQKTNLRSNLAKLKIPATETESLKSLVDKVGTATAGKRSAYGVVDRRYNPDLSEAENSKPIVVRNLDFRPSIVLVSTPMGGSFFHSAGIVPIATSTDQFVIYPDGFQVRHLPGWVTWQAIE